MSKEKLALYGGTPARTAPWPRTFPGALDMGDEEAQAVMEVLQSRNLFRYAGPSDVAPHKVKDFEKAFAAHLGARYVLGVTSGTAALMTALAAAGIGPGDEVIIPAYTWIATATAVVWNMGIPIIAEVDETLTLDPDDVARRITPRTRAIIPVHMRGAPCNMDAFTALARKHNLRLIEDVAQANGGSYHGQRLGTFGDLGAFSLQFYKMSTTGERGADVPRRRGHLASRSRCGRFRYLHRRQLSHDRDRRRASGGAVAAAGSADRQAACRQGADHRRHGRYLPREGLCAASQP